MENSAQYYRRRAAEEQQAAEQAITINSKAAHRGLAAKYAALAAGDRTVGLAAE